MNPKTGHSSERRDFLQLFMNSQKSIYSYILSMVHNKIDAEDLTQETALLMWDKYDEFEAGTSFVAWGIQIARYKVLSYYRNKKDIKRFDDDLLDGISKSYQRKISEVKGRLEALDDCLEKLNSKDRELIRFHYEQGLKITQLKNVIGGSVHVLYRTMARIHALLHRCVNRTMGEWNYE